MIASWDSIPYDDDEYPDLDYEEAMYQQGAWYRQGLGEGSDKA